MATAKWATPSAQGSNIASTTIDSLTNGSTSSTFITYDNSTALDLYASVEIDLGSITPVAGGSITLRAFATSGTNPPSPVALAAIGGDAYAVPLDVSASAKVLIIPMIRLYPCSMRFLVTNNSGVTLAASGNALKVQPFNESVA